MHECRRYRQAFREGWGKLEGPEITVWHKVCLIICFLLVAFLWLAHLVINPPDNSHHGIHICSMDTLSYIHHFVCDYIFAFCIMTLNLCYYHMSIYLPLWIRYRWIWLKILYQWRHLSWQWWLIMFIGLWNEPTPKNIKINVTYWMHIRANTCAVQSHFKDLHRWRRTIDKSHVYQYKYRNEMTALMQFFTMIFLSILGLAYFVWCILLYKIHPSSFVMKCKHPWTKRHN